MKLKAAHLSLIRAALGDEQALQEFRGQTPDWSRIPYPWTRLFPLLASRLELAFRPAEKEILKQHCLQVFRENSMLRHVALGLLEQFQQASIEVVVLKGLAVAEMVYPQFDLRPMGDFDLLVRPADVARAQHVLVAAGWAGDVGLAGDLHSVHAASFAHPRGVHMDLHWAALNGCLWGGADEAFWERSQPFFELQRGARVLSPADNLVHLCLHGYLTGWSGLWVCDCCLLLRQQEPLWDDVVAEARQRRLSPLLLQALMLLRETFGAQIPAGVIDRLRALPVSPATRLYCWCRQHAQAPIAFVLLPWLEFRRNRPPQTNFWKYLRRRWRLPDGQSLPREVWQRLRAWAQRRKA